MQIWSSVSAGLLRKHGEDVREVALLTPYRAQLSVLRRAAQRELDEKALLNVTFATIDGFRHRGLMVFVLLPEDGVARSLGFSLER